jgi:hypothetical protein
MLSDAIYLRVVPLMLIGLVLPGFLRDYHEHSLACGLLVGQTMAAAAWLVLGPMLLHWRLLIAVIWPAVCYLVADEHIFQGEFVGSNDLAVFLAALWMTTFALLALAMSVSGWRLHRGDQPILNRPRTAWQFRVRELLTITAAVAVVLAAGRVVLPEFLRTTWMLRSWSYWTCWLIAAVLLGLPLFCAALRLQSRWSNLLLELVLACFGGVLLEFLRESLLPNWPPLKPQLGPTIAVGLLWITLFGVAIRSSDYQLGRFAAAEKSQRPTA